MLAPVNYIFDTIKKMTRIKDTLTRIKNKEKVEIKESILLSNIDAAFIDIHMALKALEYTTITETRKNVDIITNLLPMTEESYRTLRAKDETDLVEYLPIVTQFLNIINVFETDGNIKYMSGYHMSTRNFSGDWGYGRFEIPDEVFDRVIEKVENRPINLLHLGCYFAKTLLHIKDIRPETKVYGVTPYDEVILTEEERSKIERLIMGDVKNIKISNDCFDVVIVTPTLTLTQNADNVTKEKKMFDRAFTYLRKDGVMICAIPTFFITQSIATFFSKNLKDVNIYRDENLMPDVVILSGVKRSAWERELDPELFVKLRNLVINLDEEANFFYQLPQNRIEITRFRGGKLDTNEMNRLYSQSGAVKDFWKKQKVHKITDKLAHPLLPFNVGQLGLVLTSGCLDGIIEEQGECSHVVKGRVVKITDTERRFNDDGNQVQISSTTSNRVEISMFLPDGTYKCLA